MLITTFHNRRDALSMEQAVSESIDYEATIRSNGTIERLEAKVEQQNAMIARMLMVQFGHYDDHFTGPEYEPKSPANQLAFILGSNMIVREL